MTPGVRQFVRVVIPATLGAGVYQISAFIDTFFLTRIGTGAMSYFNYADRLNQLPLGVIGAALGTAILPQVSRHVGAGEPELAAKVQGQAAELAMLLCLPAALALSVASGPLVSALFQGGRFSAADASITALTLAIIVTGLPAYVLVKVLTPGFYSRQDTATPVKTAGIVLLANIALNFLLIPPFGIAGLAAAIAICSWLNCVMLYVILHRRGHFRIEPWLASRIARQLLAGLVMAAVLFGIRTLLHGWFSGSVGQRMVGVAAIVGGGLAVYFPLVWLIGGMGKEEIQTLVRRRRSVEGVGPELQSRREKVASAGLAAPAQSARVVIGYVLLALGAAGLILGLTMSAAIETPMGPINNIGLLNDKQNIVIASGFVMVVGALLALFGRSGSNSR